MAGVAENGWNHLKWHDLAGNGMIQLEMAAIDWKQLKLLERAENNRNGLTSDILKVDFLSPSKLYFPKLRQKYPKVT